MGSFRSFCFIFYSRCLLICSRPCSFVRRLLSGDVSRPRLVNAEFQAFKASVFLSRPRLGFYLVLSVLCEDRFADDRLSLNILTAKSVFLLALASWERRSALAALAYPPRFDELHMSISYHRDFILKSYFVRKNVTSLSPIRIPFVSEDSCVQVCPCRTTLFYLDVVAIRSARCS